MLHPDRAWVDARRYPDLDARAERALREAGLHFSQGRKAEAYLQVAATIAPSHEAVIIAQYRYFLYKHRFWEAAEHARAYLTLIAGRLGLDPDPLRVSRAGLDLEEQEIPSRAWLFGCQAYAYALMRSGHRAAGEALLLHVLEVDETNLSRSVELWNTIQRAEEADDDEEA